MIFDRKKKRSREKKLHGGHVWGLRVDKRVSNGCGKVAAFIGVPIGMFVSYMFISWLNANDHSLQDQESVRELARRIRAVDEGLRGIHPMHHKKRSAIADEEMINLALPWSLRGIDLQTRLRIKALARNDQTTMSQLINTMVSREWKERGDEMAGPNLSRAFGKDVRKILNYTAKRGRYIGNRRAHYEDNLED